MKIQVHENATIFLGDAFVRITGKSGGETANTSFAWNKIACVTTIGKVEEEPTPRRGGTRPAPRLTPPRAGASAPGGRSAPGTFRR